MPYIKVGQENSESIDLHAIAWTHADRVSQALFGFLKEQTSPRVPWR
jgi:hypothetical protein